MNKTMMNAALALAFGVMAVSAQAATLNTGDKLVMNTGVATASGAYVSGSYFGMDGSGDSKIQPGEKVAITTTNPIVIGQTQAPGAFDTWSFYGAPGSHFTSTAITGGTSGLDMSGWTVNWNGGNINMGGTAWTPLNCAALGCGGLAFNNSTASFTWDGVYGNAFSLFYTATVPTGSFAGVKYLLNVTGTVQAAPAAVPVPAAAWLLGSGLLGLVGVARRRNQA